MRDSADEQCGNCLLIGSGDGRRCWTLISVVARGNRSSPSLLAWLQRGREGCAIASASSVEAACCWAVAAGAVAGIWKRLQRCNRSSPSLLAWQAREGVHDSAGRQCGNCLLIGGANPRALLLPALPST